MISDTPVSTVCERCGERASSRDTDWVEHARKTHICPPVPCPCCNGNQPCPRVLQLAMAGKFDG